MYPGVPRGAAAHDCNFWGNYTYANETELIHNGLGWLRHVARLRRLESGQNFRRWQ